MTMTTEQKAKAYEEALERARALNNGEAIDVEAGTTTCEYIFPELKESYSERIKKKLLSLIEWSTSYYESGITDDDVKEMTDWIEKQDEQKSKFRVGDTIKSKYDDRQFTIKSVDLDKGAYTYTQEGCGNDIDYADEEFELVEQKPVAWSEEDEKAVNDIMWIIEAYRKNGFNETHIQIADSSENWLKSLKERVSKFDDGYKVGFSAAKYSQWKPSDGQISLLQAIINDPNNAASESCQIVLKEVIKQLKKLRKE